MCYGMNVLLSCAEKMVDYWYATIPRAKPDIDALKKSKIIAHRGAHHKLSGIVENTDAAFKQAELLGCWGIEFDIRATADEKLVINHDSTLKRLWKHNIAIKDLLFNELRQLEPSIPLLSEVIARYGQSLHLFIELKTPFNAEKELVEALKPLTPCKHYHLLSLDEAVFSSLQTIPRKAMILVPMSNNTKEFCQLSIDRGYGGVAGHYLLLTNKLIRQVQSANQHVGVGMIDSRFSLYREVKREINWLFTNNAQKICSLISKGG